MAGADDGLQARAAQAVDVKGRGALATTALDGGHARQVHVLGFGVDHMAEHDVAHVLAIDLGARQRLAHDQCRQLGRRHIFEAAAKGANGGTDSADNYNFTGHGELLWG